MSALSRALAIWATGRPIPVNLFATLAEQGYDVPAEIVVPHTMRQVTDDDCDPDRVTPTVSGTSLVPSEVLAEMYAVKDRRMREAIAQGRLTVKPGLWRLLDWLDKHAVPRAVASSTYRELVLKKLSAARLLDRFHAIVGGDEVAHGKPAPDIFLEAARRLSAPPNRCVVLEDSDNGARAALSAGMRVIVIPDLKLPAADVQQSAWRVLTSLEEAIQALGQARGSAPGR